MNPLTSKVNCSLQYLYTLLINFCVKKSLLDLVAIKDTIKGVDIKNAINFVLSENIPPECLINLVSI